MKKRKQEEDIDWSIRLASAGIMLFIFLIISSIIIYIGEDEEDEEINWYCQEQFVKIYFNAEDGLRDSGTSYYDTMWEKRGLQNDGSLLKDISITTSCSSDGSQCIKSYVRKRCVVE